MLNQALYRNGAKAVSVRLERIDVLLKSETEVLCFPRLIELQGDRLVLVYLKKWHEQVGERWEYPFAFHTGPGCSYMSTEALAKPLQVGTALRAVRGRFGETSLPGIPNRGVLQEPPPWNGAASCM